MSPSGEGDTPEASEDGARWAQSSRDEDEEVFGRETEARPVARSLGAYAAMGTV